jgi:hypothetical protein
VIWNPVVTGDLAVQAVRVARDISERLSSSRNVAEAAAVAHVQTKYPRPTWAPYALSEGYAGLALLWSYLDSCFVGENWDVKGREHLALAVRGAEAASEVPLGLLSGLSGLAFSASQLSRQGTRYRRLLSTLDDVIVRKTFALAASLRERRNGLGVDEFDAISGLSGVIAYLLCRTNEPGVTNALHDSILALESILDEGDGLPAWYTPRASLWDDEQRAVYPNGNLNCGLAHGIPGPLAVLSLGLRAGLSTPGLPEAITKIVDWLCDNRSDDDWGVNWPTAVAIAQPPASLDSGVTADRVPIIAGAPSRCAWCYGSPGVARAVWLAGDALDRDDYRALAVSAMEAVFRRPVIERHIDSPTFCHGVAGLLAVALRFANDTGADVFIDGARALVEQLIGSYRPESLLGFRNLEFAGHEVDQPGLLDGAAGVAIVLLAAATSVEPTWNRAFLLS